MKLKITITVLLAAACLSAGMARAEVLAESAAVYPVSGLTAGDMPYDAGGFILLKWAAMPYDGLAVQYKVFSSTAQDGPWLFAGSTRSDRAYSSDIKLPFWAWTGSKNQHALPVEIAKIFPPPLSPAAAALVEKFGGHREKFTGRQNFEVESGEVRARRAYEEGINRTRYFFKVAAVSGAQSAESAVVSAVPAAAWFSLPRLNNLIYALALAFVFLWLIFHAKRKTYFLRRLAGLDAIDEAIGRATEMGRPVYYMTGRYDIDKISTIASTFILAEVAKKTARYGAQLKVPHAYPMTMAVCQEIVKQAYTEEGRPDYFREDINFFLSSDQFAYTAAADGLMARDKPAACFYAGYYYSESLLLTEVGASVGAIQIAITDAEAQLPFFFTTCDYTIMGEELYAASAYLSKDPVLVGTVRGQDLGKIFVMAAIAVGIIAVAVGTVCHWSEFVRVVLDPVTSF
ncbi:MAG: DUF6754 domain-containing protein [Elusimicrobiaceae bacterium]